MYALCLSASPANSEHKALGFYPNNKNEFYCHFGQMMTQYQVTLVTQTLNLELTWRLQKPIYEIMAFWSFTSHSTIVWKEQERLSVRSWNCRDQLVWTTVFCRDTVKRWVKPASHNKVYLLKFYNYFNANAPLGMDFIWSHKINIF